MKKKITIIASLLIVIAGIGAWFFFPPSEKVPESDLDISQALGMVTAEETAKLLNNKGEIVIISWGSNYKMPMIEAQLTSFARALKNYEGIQITMTEKVLRNSAQMAAIGVGMPADEFMRVVKAHPSAGAIVLFLPFPNLATDALETINKSQTKFVVVSGCNPGYKKLLIDRTIDLAIVPQFDRTKNTHPPQTSQESFDQNYQIVTPENAASLPY